MLRFAVIGLLGYSRASQLLDLNEDELKARFSTRFLRGFRQLEQEKNTALDFIDSKTNICLKEIGEGGLYAAIWDMCEEYKIPGCRIYVDDIPVKQEVIEILELYGDNPYELASEDSFLISWEEQNLSEKEALSLMEHVSVIGYGTGKKGRVIVSCDSERYLTPPQRQAKDIAYRMLNNNKI